MEIVETEKLVWRIHSAPCPDFSHNLQELESQAVLHLNAARSAAHNAYAPYSNFRVGSSVLAADDKKEQSFSGCNVENGSYGATMCAERVAINSAVAAGFQQFRILALSTLDTANEEDLRLRAPCGLCRQVMSEFFDPLTIILIDGGHQSRNRDCVDFMTIDVILPWRFKL